MSFDHPEFTLPLPTEALPLPLSVRSDGGGIDSSLLVLDLHLAPVTDGRSGPIATAADTAFESVLRAFVARGRSGALPPPFEILSAGDEQVVTSAYEGDPDGDDDGDGIPNKDDPDGDIVVTGKRPRVYEPNPGTDTGGGGGSSTGTGGGQYTHSEDDPCADGAAVEAKDRINELVEQIGRYEFAGIVIKNPDGTYGLYRDILYTDYSPTYATLPNLNDASAAAGIVHNHPWNVRTENPSINFINRYPGPEDWAALDRLVASGANAANLSAYVVDPWGVVREFKYQDKEKYENMTDQQRTTADENLPAPTSKCGASS